MGCGLQPISDLLEFLRWQRKDVFFVEITNIIATDQDSMGVLGA
jgi:hypothetical protein